LLIRRLWSVATENWCASSCFSAVSASNGPSCPGVRGLLGQDQVLSEAQQQGLA
jgi:hypothetical protein